MSLGKRLKQIRQQHGMTSVEFGTLFDAPQSAVSQWEHDINKPNVERLKSISNFAGITVEQLLTGNNPLEIYSDEELLQELLRRQKNPHGNAD